MPSSGTRIFQFSHLSVTIIVGLLVFFAAAPSILAQDRLMGTNEKGTAVLCECSKQRYFHKNPDVILSAVFCSEPFMTKEESCVLNESLEEDDEVDATTEDYDGDYDSEPEVEIETTTEGTEATPAFLPTIKNDDASAEDTTTGEEISSADLDCYPSQSTTLFSNMFLIIDVIYLG